MWLRRARPARVAIVDDDLEVAMGLAASLAADERIAVHRLQPTATAEAILGELLSWRADLVVLDLEVDRAWSGEVLVRSLRACGTEVVVRTARLDPPLPPGTAVVHRCQPIEDVLAAVRQRLPLLRGRPAPPRIV